MEVLSALQSSPESLTSDEAAERLACIGPNALRKRKHSNFALALAVELTVQLLPAIISVNLARGARWMSAQGVIVKRLATIDNFGGKEQGLSLCSRGNSHRYFALPLALPVD